MDYYMCTQVRNAPSAIAALHKCMVLISSFVSNSIREAEGGGLTL